MEHFEKKEGEGIEKQEKPINAACILVKNEEGKILLFRSSYKRTSGQNEAVGLPAGLIDRLDSGGNEDPEIAATRELFEEAGLKVIGSLVLLYDGETPSGKRVVTYFCPAWEGELQQSNEGTVYWGTREELTGVSGGYPDYNKKVLEALEKLTKNPE